MNEQIEDFILDDKLMGDDTYITDGCMLLRKSALDSFEPISRLLLNFHTKEPLKIEYIPYDKGVEVEHPDEAFLWTYNNIVVPFGDKFFSYKYIKLAHMLTEDISSYTLVSPSEKFADGPWLLKFWDESGEFVGCLAEMRR